MTPEKAAAVDMALLALLLCYNALGNGATDADAVKALVKSTRKQIAEIV